MILLRVYFCQVITMNKRNGGWSDEKKNVATLSKNFWNKCFWQNWKLRLCEKNKRLEIFLLLLFLTILVNPFLSILLSFFLYGCPFLKVFANACVFVGSLSQSRLHLFKETLLNYCLLQENSTSKVLHHFPAIFLPV